MYFKRFLLVCFLLVATRRGVSTYLACICDSLSFLLDRARARISYSNWDPQTHDINTRPWELIRNAGSSLVWTYGNQNLHLTDSQLIHFTVSLRITGSGALEPRSADEEERASWQLSGPWFLSVCHPDLGFLGMYTLSLSWELPVVVSMILWRRSMGKCNSSNRRFTSGQYFTQSSLGSRIRQ